MPLLRVLDVDGYVALLLAQAGCVRFLTNQIYARRQPSRTEEVRCPYTWRQSLPDIHGHIEGDEENDIDAARPS